MKVRQIVAATAEIDQARVEVERAGGFDAKNETDARKRALRAIVLRQGQGTFRRKLLEVYGGTCCITGCAFEQVLEAAHIQPYRGEHTNAVENGLLLRADVHTLFDLYLLWIDRKRLAVAS